MIVHKEKTASQTLFCRDMGKLFKHMVGTKLDPFTVLTDLMSK